MKHFLIAIAVLATTTFGLTAEEKEYVEGTPVIEILVDTDNDSVADTKISIDKQNPSEHLYIVDPEGRFDKCRQVK